MIKEKQLLIDEMQDKINRSEGMIITHYNKLDPQHSWNFSQDLRKVDAEFEVVKKRVFKKAASEKGIELDFNDSKGHLGVLFIYGKSLDAAKLLYSFGASNQDCFNIVAGRFEGHLYASADVKKISELPPLNELRSQLLGLFEAPMSRTLSVMNGLLCSVMHCLENKIKK